MTEPRSSPIRALETLLDHASRRGEQTIAGVRLVLVVALLVRMLIMDGDRLIAGHPEILLHLVVMAGTIAFSAWTVRVAAHIRALRALLAASVAVDALAIGALHVTMILFLDDYTGTTDSRHLGAWYLAVIALTARLDPKIALVGIAMHGAVLAGVFVTEHAVLPGRHVYDLQTIAPVVIYFFTAALLAWGLARRTRSLVSRGAASAREAERARQHLGAYISEELAAHALDTDALVLGGARQPVAVLFTDLRGFTRYAESLPPEQLVSELNDYLEAMVAAVRAHGGVVDKYIGDAVMAVFGVPNPADDDAARALCAAQALTEALAAHNLDRAARGLPSLAHGIGVHYGPVIAGNIGAAARMQYTVVGDVVNVASRLEGATKELGVPVLVSAAAVEAARASGRSVPALTVHGVLPLRGRSAPLEVYTLEAVAAPAVPARTA